MAQLLPAEPMGISRTPEGGPSPLFFSGGSALGACSRRFKKISHNSVHLTTPFDSGGSSAALREAFAMPSLGDLRSRLLCLSDDTGASAGEVEQLFSYRYPTSVRAGVIERDLHLLVEGRHALLDQIPAPIVQRVRAHLAALVKRRPWGLSLHEANLGNLILAGGFLELGRDLSSLIAQWKVLLRVRGHVDLTSVDDKHLAVRLKSGEVLYGQASFTGKGGLPIDAPIEELFVVDELRRPRRVDPVANPAALARIEDAALLCYPMGSFYSSVACHLLPRGVARVVAEHSGPKLFVPNLGRDPEQLGMSLAGAIRQLAGLARRDHPRIEASDLVSHVLVDRARGLYSLGMDVDEVRALGIDVIDVPLARRPHEVDPELFCDALVSFC